MSSTKRSSSSSGGGPSAAEKAAAAKAKEEANRAKEELVRAMADPTKADLLAQALLREYMHRKGFKKTLASFDKENPRTETTISSRELMNNLLTTQFIQKRNALRPEPLPTIMETLCSYRLRKRTLRQARGLNGPEADARAATTPYSLEGPEGEHFDSSDEERELGVMAATHSKMVADRLAANKAAQEAYAAAVAEAEASAAGTPSKSKKKKGKKAGKDDDDDDDDVDDGGKKKKKKDKKEKKSDKKKDAAPMTVTAVGRGFDPLGLSKGGGGTKAGGEGFIASSLGGGGGFGFGSAPSSSSSGGGGGRGRWMPDAAPTIGLSSDSSSLFNFTKPGAGGDDDDDKEGGGFKRPSFVAGDGFKLSTDKTNKVSAANATDVWGGDKPRGNSHGNSPSGHSRMGSMDRGDEVPSPYANLGHVRYDANAKAKSVLSGGGSGNGNKGAGAAGRRITWGSEGTGSESTSEVGSPVSSSPAGGGGATKVGFGFNTSPGSPGGGTRARRTVTIIDQ